MRGRYRRLRRGQSRRHLHLRKARRRSCQQISRPAQYLLTPCVEQPAANPMLPRHLGRCKGRTQTFGHDVALLLPCPSPPRLAPAKNLHRRAARTPMTYPTRTLSIGGRHRRSRHLVHAWLRSYRRPLSQCVAAMALTPPRTSREDIDAIVESVLLLGSRLDAARGSNFGAKPQPYNMTA